MIGAKEMKAVTDLERSRFPTGRFVKPAGPLDSAARAACIAAIERAPRDIRALVEGLSAAQLDTPYRPGGWTIRQVTHHVPDSHINAYVRFKLALTEDAPTIKPYNEAEWAKLSDVSEVPVTVSLNLLDAVHTRWLAILRAMTEADFLRTFNHPELGPLALYDALALYAWHGRHHTAHIEQGLGIKN